MSKLQSESAQPPVPQAPVRQAPVRQAPVRQALVVFSRLPDPAPVLTLLDTAGIGHALAAPRTLLNRVTRAPLLLLLDGADPMPLPDLRQRQAETVAVVREPGEAMEDALVRAGVHEVLALDGLTPDHLVRALRRARLRQTMGADAHQAREMAYALLDRIPLALILVRGNGRIVYANTRAERLVTAGQVLGRGPRGILHAGRRDDTEALLNTVAACARGDPGTEGAIALHAADGGAPASVIVVPAGQAAQGAALFIAEPDSGVTIDAKRLAGLYGLTRSEARILARLACGETVDQIAKAGGHQLSTIRSQLKSVFAKTGTRRQPDLIKLVLSGPAVFASEPQTGAAGVSGGDAG